MWNIKLDSDNQPILPKQVKCIENIIANVDPKYSWMGKFEFLVIGEVYDVLPYPYKLSKSETKNVLGKNGMLFMNLNGGKVYINKNYFEPYDIHC